jgi:redox-sensitive bicupin YhaK (pirin superfamily)
VVVAERRPTREELIDETLAESFPASDAPSWTLGVSSDSIELVIPSRSRDIGGLTVRRALPSAQRRLVGPFIFLDHMGPLALEAGEGFDVRPHPHIGLATLTYLFDGDLVHRDNLGSHRTIRPGHVNWMLAGGGVVHSERSSDESRARGARLHGIQSWVALPTDQEEAPARFEHHDESAIPRITRSGATLDVLVGSVFGVRSPAPVLSPTLYVHARLEAGARLPLDGEHEDRAAYVVEGSIACDGRVFSPGTMIVFRSGSASIEAHEASRVMILGGAKLEGERHIFWNFVSSSKERIERAKDDWRSDRFPKVPGDEVERVPLPR